MAKSKRTYVTYKDLERIKKEYKPKYTIVYGGRNDGKSYAVKEKVIRDFLKNGSMFTYLRRYEADIKEVDNVLYWDDFISGEVNKIEELSGGLYNGITVEKKGIFFTQLNEDGKTVTADQIGYIHALSTEQRLKSLQFPKIRTIIYEEFCTAGTYLYKEISHFNSYVSTVARSRGDVDVYLIGNTISKHNIFFREWQLNNVGSQKPGTVDIYKFSHEDVEIRVAAYYTTTVKENTMFFGTGAKMITGGEWESEEQPHLEGNEEEYVEVYRLSVEIDTNNRYLCRFMVKSNIGVWYVTKRTSVIKQNERIISPDYRESNLYTNAFIPINNGEKRIFPYIKMGRIVYGDNLTGTEFKRALKQLTIMNKD